MDNLLFFMQQGLWHIADLSAYDHMLFLIGLCAVYPLERWKSLLWLITAFTLGHSLSLALSVLDWIRIEPSLVEMAIPLTILFTALSNLRNPANQQANYALVTLFGLIHGLGFSNYLRFLLEKQASLATPLLGFNLGLELGQILILLAAFTCLILLRRIWTFSQRDLVLVLSGAVAGLALVLSIEQTHAYFFPS